MKLKFLIFVVILFMINSLFIGAVAKIQNKSAEDYDWNQIHEDGFGNIENVGVRGIEIFDDNVVIGTASFSNDSGLVIGKSMPIKDIYFEYFLNRSATDNFKSNGCEIWAYNGLNLTPIIEDNGVMECGFKDKNNSEIGFLINFGNYLYAGTRNFEEGCEIWRTNNLESEWECVVDSGFGNKKNSWAMEADIFKSYLYVGTYNKDEGTEIYRTKDGINWTEVVGKNSETKNGFGTKNNFYTWSMSVYNDNLYVGTDYIGDNGYGGELWRTSNGSDWEPIISDSEGSLYPLDFKKTWGYHGGIRNMIFFKGELYIGFVSIDTHFTFGLKNFERLKIKMYMTLPSKLNFFRIRRTLGLEIYKFNDTTNELTTIIGGVKRGVFSGGFGDDNNEYPWSMCVHNDTLYVGTSNVESYDIVFERIGLFRWNGCIKAPIGGGEIWKYNDEDCEQINSNGFGDIYNTGIREMIVYKNRLISGLLNVKTGCELWELNLTKNPI